MKRHNLFTLRGPQWRVGVGKRYRLAVARLSDEGGVRKFVRAVMKTPQRDVGIVHLNRYPGHAPLMDIESIFRPKGHTDIVHQAVDFCLGTVADLQVRAVELTQLATEPHDLCTLPDVKIGNPGLGIQVAEPHPLIDELK